MVCIAVELEDMQGIVHMVWGIGIDVPSAVGNSDWGQDNAAVVDNPGGEIVD